MLVFTAKVEKSGGTHESEYDLYVQRCHYKPGCDRGRYTGVCVEFGISGPDRRNNCIPSCDPGGTSYTEAWKIDYL